jgi:hypothetical protein
MTTVEGREGIGSASPPDHTCSFLFSKMGHPAYWQAGADAVPWPHWAMRTVAALVRRGRGEQTGWGPPPDPPGGGL